jgi:2-hydroxychromene-2-carboxylate isomerase
MTKPMITIHNTETNEVVEREMTAAEFKIYEANQAAQAVAKAEAEAKAQAKETARQAILDRLGLTADEAKLILG